MRHLMLVGAMCLVWWWLAGCGTPQTIVVSVTGQGAGISAPQPLWGEPSALATLDTPTTHTMAIYTLGKQAITALGLGLGGAALGAAHGGPAGGVAGGTGGALLGRWLDHQTTDTQANVMRWALERRGRMN